MTHEKINTLLYMRAFTAAWFFTLPYSLSTCSGFLTNLIKKDEHFLFQQSYFHNINKCMNNLLLCWYLHLVMVGELEYPNNLESYAAGSVATGRVQVHPWWTGQRVGVKLREVPWSSRLGVECWTDSPTSEKSRYAN